MKLIIDIPKSEYTEIKRYYDSLPEYSTVEAETYYIAHGTPLDDVKAEIEKELCHSIRDEYSQRQNDYCDGVEFAGKRCLEIIDKHIGKAESEDEE